MKKTFSPLYISLLAFGALVTSVHASPLPQVEGTSTKKIQSSSIETKIVPPSLYVACIQSALDKRNASTTVARQVYSSSTQSALADYNTASEAALLLENDEAIKVAQDEAVESYKNAVTLAQDTLVAARKAAWTQFEYDSLLCKKLKQNSNKKGDDKKVEKIDKEKKSAQLLDDTVDLTQDVMTDKAPEKKAPEDSPKVEKSSIKEIFEGVKKALTF